jgi:hypothetical protein
MRFKRPVELNNNQKNPLGVGSGVSNLISPCDRQGAMIMRRYRTDRAHFALRRSGYTALVMDRAWTGLMPNSTRLDNSASEVIIICAGSLLRARRLRFTMARSMTRSTGLCDCRSIGTRENGTLMLSDSHANTKENRGSMAF